jgi:hypothetical protein
MSNSFATRFGGLPRFLAASSTLLMAIGAGPAFAAALVWSAPAAITGDVDVRTQGSLVMAYNFGSTADATVNGVAFQAFFVPPPPAFDGGNPPNPHQHTVGNATLAMADRERDTNFLANFSSGNANLPFSGLSGGYQGLLGTSAGNNFPDRFSNPAVLTLAGLILGQTYEFQAWFNDSGTAGAFGYPLSLWDAADPQSAVSLRPNLLTDPQGDLVAGGLGQYVVASFTANASTQAFAFMREEVPGGLNGFQLRLANAGAVPTPSGLALVAMALVAAAGAGRRRAAALGR